MLDNPIHEQQFLLQIPEQIVNKQTINADGPLFASSGTDSRVKFGYKGTGRVSDILSFTQNR